MFVTFCGGADDVVGGGVDMMVDVRIVAGRNENGWRGGMCAAEEEGTLGEGGG